MIETSSPLSRFFGCVLTVKAGLLASLMFTVCKHVQRLLFTLGFERRRSRVWAPWCMGVTLKSNQFNYPPGFYPRRLFSSNAVRQEDPERRGHFGLPSHGLSNRSILHANSTRRFPESLSELKAVLSELLVVLCLCLLNSSNYAQSFHLPFVSPEPESPAPERYTHVDQLPELQNRQPCRFCSSNFLSLLFIAL